MKKKTNLLYLASKGRKGDTEIRRVNGKLSHVNQQEAGWIDTHGKVGEAMTQAVGSGTTNPNTGLPEYGFGSWLKKRVTPPKKVVSALKSGDYMGAAKDMWNTNKGAIIGTLALGPLGGVLGAATADGGTWRPSQGKWGGFGQTDASKAADRAKADAKIRKADFEAFMEKYDDENIAALQTQSTLDDEGNTYTGDFKSFVAESNISPSVKDDMNKYITEYDSRPEDKLDLQSETLIDNTNAVADANSQGLFSMMQQEDQTQSQQGFAGSGNFAQQFARQQAAQATERSFADIKRSQEEVSINKGLVQDDYNKKFWDEMMGWSQDVNA